MYNINEAGLTPYEKMRDFENGVRRENVAACKNDKLKIYRTICQAHNFNNALQKIEAEMTKRGLIGNTATSQPAQQQTSPTQNTSTQTQNTTTKTYSKLGDVPRSTNVDWSNDSLIDKQKDINTITKDNFDFVKDATTAKELIQAGLAHSGSPWYLITYLVFAIVIKKDPEIIEELKRFLVINVDIPIVDLKRMVLEVGHDEQITNQLDIWNNTNECLHKSTFVEALEKTTPYMLRNDGAFLTCGDIHPYIKMQYKQSLADTYSTLLTNYEFLDWFFYNTNNPRVKDLICKFLSICEQRPEIVELKDKIGIVNTLTTADDTLENILDELNDLTNQEFCKVRTSNFKYKYGGDNGEIYFRIGSKNFNWFDLIYQVVSDYSVSIRYVTIMKDYAATGERFKYLSYKGKDFNKMPINEFLSLPGNPIVESLNESEGKQDTLNPKLWDGMELKPEVKDKIDMIVNEFLDTLNQDDIDNIKISDIILVGSNVSYNYTSNSDIDIHIRIDLSIYDEPEQRNIMSRLVSAYAKVWNNKYTISFYGIPVELFIETKFDVDEDWQLL